MGDKRKDPSGGKKRKVAKLGNRPHEARQRQAELDKGAFLASHATGDVDAASPERKRRSV